MNIFTYCFTRPRNGTSTQLCQKQCFFVVKLIITAQETHGATDAKEIAPLSFVVGAQITSVTVIITDDDTTDLIQQVKPHNCHLCVDYV